MGRITLNLLKSIKEALSFTCNGPTVGKSDIVVSLKKKKTFFFARKSSRRKDPSFASLSFCEVGGDLAEVCGATRS